MAFAVGARLQIKKLPSLCVCACACFWGGLPGVATSGRFLARASLNSQNGDRYISLETGRKLRLKFNGSV